MMRCVSLLSSRRLVLLPFVLMVSTHAVRSCRCSSFMLLRRMLASSDMRRPVFAKIKSACCASPCVRLSMKLSSSRLRVRCDSLCVVFFDLMYRVGFFFIMLCCSR